MAMSGNLQAEVAAMAKIEAALRALPDDQTRARVVRWVTENYSPDGSPVIPSDPASPRPSVHQPAE